MFLQGIECEPLFFGNYFVCCVFASEFVWYARLTVCGDHADSRHHEENVPWELPPEAQAAALLHSHQLSPIRPPKYFEAVFEMSFIFEMKLFSPF